MGLVAWLNRPGPFGRAWRRAYEWGYACLRGVTALIFGPFFRVRRIGPLPEFPEGGLVLCPNHASYLDPAFVQLCVHRRVIFVMTNDFYARRWGRWFFTLVGAIPVGRGRLARTGLRRAIAHARRGHVVVVFPEGRLSRDGNLHRAQRGIAILARRARVPVYPMAIVGSMRAWRHGARRPRRANVRVTFGQEPMTWSGEPGRGAQQAFADELMRRITALRTSLLNGTPHRFDRHTYKQPDSPTGSEAAGVQKVSTEGR
ncbi:MAG: lysophospholipid acyltransferase family protein [Planctomycetota bacterium]|nr:lysophospholipid acyltransferase family protein [Planctomycetota bacterium]